MTGLEITIDELASLVDPLELRRRNYADATDTITTGRPCPGGRVTAAWRGAERFEGATADAGGTPTPTLRWIP